MTFARTVHNALLAVVSLACGCGPGEPRLDAGVGGHPSTGGLGGDAPGDGGGPPGGAGSGASDPRGGGGSPGQADLGEVAFELFIWTEPVTPGGEGGKDVPYYVNVCVSAGGTNNHVGTKNLGDAPANAFAIAATLLGTAPSFGVEIGSCTIVDAVRVDAGESYFFTAPGCCQIEDHLNTFDFAYPRKIRVTVDAEGVVDESDESNNEAVSNEIDIANDASAIGFNG